MEVATSSCATTGNSRGVPVIFVFCMADSTTHLHGATTLTAQEDDWAGDIGIADDLGVMLLLPICHHVEVLMELGIMVKFVAQVGQTHQLSV
jgi:hypothetical protein